MHYLILVDALSVDEGDVDDVRVKLLTTNQAYDRQALRVEHHIYTQGSVSGNYKWIQFADWLIKEKGFKEITDPIQISDL